MFGDGLNRYNGAAGDTVLVFAGSRESVNEQQFVWPG